MSIEVDTVTGPTFLAPALINGDRSGLTDEEEACLERFLAGLNNARVVSVTDDEPRFTWSFDLYGGNARGGDILDYIIHRPS